MENIATNKRNLMNPDELLKLDNNKEIVIVRGRKPFICNKYDYSKHIEASKMEDMTIEEQRERFKDNVENEKNSYKKSKNVIKHCRKPSKNVRKLKISKKA